MKFVLCAIISMNIFIVISTFTKEVLGSYRAGVLLYHGWYSINLRCLLFIRYNCKKFREG